MLCNLRNSAQRSQLRSVPRLGLVLASVELEGDARQKDDKTWYKE